MSDPIVPVVPATPVVQPASPSSPPKPAPKPKSSTFPWILGLVAVAGVGYWWWRKRHDATAPALPAPMPRSMPTVAASASASRSMPTPKAAPMPVPKAGDPFSVLGVEAPKYGIDPRMARAVMQVESGGKVFGPDGKMIVRFEPHVFAKLTAAKKLGKTKISNAEMASAGARVLLPGMSDLWDKKNRKGGQADEWDALARARAIDEEAGLASASFGLGQLMGFNFKVAGYKSAREMFDAFQSSGEEQVRGMLRFIAASKKQVEALRNKDFAGFVAIYNGAPRGSSGNNSYVQRMEKAYAASV